MIGRLLRGERGDRDDAAARRSPRGAGGRGGTGGRRAGTAPRCACSSVSGVTAVAGPGVGPPEFQTSTSMPPNALTVVSTARSRSLRDRDVAAHGERADAVGLALEQVAPAGEHRDVRSFGGQGLRRREPEPGRGARDEGGTPLQSEIHGELLAPLRFARYHDATTPEPSRSGACLRASGGHAPPCARTCPWGDPWGRRRPHEAERSDALAAEAALGVDHLAGDPAGVVAAQPGDESRGVVGLAPAAGRHPSGRIDVGEAPAGVGRAGVDAVHRDAAVGELVRRASASQRAARPSRRRTRARRSSARWWTPEVIRTTRPRVALVLRGELLDEQQRRADVLVQERVEVLGRDVAPSRPSPLRAWLTTRTSSGPSACARRGDDACRRVRHRRSPPR